MKRLILSMVSLLSKWRAFAQRHWVHAAVFAVIWLLPAAVLTLFIPFLEKLQDIGVSVPAERVIDFVLLNHVFRPEGPILSAQAERPLSARDDGTDPSGRKTLLAIFWKMQALFCRTKPANGEVDLT